MARPKLNDSNNFKASKFRLMLYPEDITHCKALEYIEKNYDCCYILHDKDIITQNDIDNHPDSGFVLGELKKAHWHIVLRVSGARWVSALASEFGVTSNYFKKCDSYEKALQYLTHYNNEDKYQYSIDEVKGSLKPRLIKVIENDGKTEDERILDLIIYIDSYPGYLSVTMFSYYCQSQGKWDLFRRSSSIFINLIREHNMSCNISIDTDEFDEITS